MRPADDHIFFSVSKPFVSTLAAILGDRGQLDVSRAIDHSMPELKGSVWEGVPVVDVLDIITASHLQTMMTDRGPSGRVWHLAVVPAS